MEQKEVEAGGIPEKKKDQKYFDRLKSWKQSRAAHKSPNRSSKHLRFFRIKDVYRCMSGAMLEKMVRSGNFSAAQEVERRDRRREKTEIRKQRYLEKIAAKRGVQK